jgi:hypothetical protein
MKNLLNYKSLIKVAIMIVVVALIGSQMMDTDAGRKRRPDDNNTSGGDQNCNENGQNGGNAECPTCCDAWDKQLGEGRFVLVMPTDANPDGEAVLDKETCLVWERVAGDTDGDEDVDEDDQLTWDDAVEHCYNRVVGGRMGMRLPTIEELMSLVDPNATVAPFLPAGHPFLHVPTGVVQFLSSNADSGGQGRKWTLLFGINGPFAGTDNSLSDSEYVWCVRAGQGHDGNDNRSFP